MANLKVAESLFRRHKTEKIFLAVYQAAFEKGYGMICWREPGESDFNCIINSSSDPNWCTPELETMGRGFIFSPYENEDNTRVLFIGADIHFTCKNGKNWIINNATQAGNTTVTDQLVESAEELLNHRMTKGEYYVRNPGHAAAHLNKNYFTSIIRDAVREITSGNFDKVVPSRYKVAVLPGSLHPVVSFLSVANTYPNSFISLVSTPYTGTWLGASPEVLISIENNEFFKTAAVAGTQEIKPGKRLSEIAWTQKEIEEQALVSRYIINCFKKIRLREFSEYGPKTVKAGNLLHLKTLFGVNMRETNFPQLGSVMLKLLHPTSAVCGMPKKEAMNFLSKSEGYDREFYSGYLGPVNIQNRTTLFVNIRCANILRKKALFYAGAGVTADSNPIKEWKETEIKIQTLSRFF